GTSCPGTSPGAQPGVEPAAVLADCASEAGLPAELRMEADDLRKLSSLAGEPEDRVREALRLELVPPEDFIGLLREADRLRHLCLCMCTQILEASLACTEAKDFLRGIRTVRRSRRGASRRRRAGRDSPVVERELRFASLSTRY